MWGVRRWSACPQGHIVVAVAVAVVAVAAAAAKLPSPLKRVIKLALLFVYGT